MDASGIYPPLNTLKRVADDVWIVDGPIIRFGKPWLNLPFPTRMTVMNLGGRRLFIHSPTPLVPELKSEIEDVGVPRWIIAPNRLHYWWLPEWHAGYPDADVYLAPRVREQAGGRIDFDAFTLDRDCGYVWDAEVATLPVPGRTMTEVTFFHRASRTLVLADLIENFEPRKIGSLLMRWLTRWAGVQDPDGGMPRDLRRTFANHQPQLRAAVLTMIRWNPERIILAHGRCYEQNGAAELRRAFRWLL
ncbi:MAG: hypothetical protein V7608_3145 [Hyphomicrobiales bacterium]|jgi:hypothetical protein